MKKEYKPHSYVDHGLSKHPLYKCYFRIKARCYNKNNPNYNIYGGRGIICEWKTFMDFYNDMISSFILGLEIDRINTNGNYCRKNCRWANRKQQMNNYRRNTIFKYKGKKYTLSEFSEKFNINRYTLKSRVNGGVTGEKLLSKTPVKFKIKKKQYA